MNKLYSVAFQRVLKTLNATQITPENVLEVLKNNNIDPYGDFIFQRTARENVRQFIKTPCPITSLTDDLSKQPSKSENTEAIIRCSKKLRESFSIEENKVCNKCSFKSLCPLNGQKYPQNDKFVDLTTNSIASILIFMQEMQNKSLINDQLGEQKADYRIWKQGYKTTDSIISLLEDLKTGGQEVKEFQRIRQKYISDLEESKINKKPLQYIEPEKIQKGLPKKSKKQKESPKKSLKRKEVEIDDEDSEEDYFESRKSYKQKSQTSQDFSTNQQTPHQSRRYNQQRFELDQRQMKFQNRKRNQYKNSQKNNRYAFNEQSEGRYRNKKQFQHDRDNREYRDKREYRGNRGQREYKRQNFKKDYNKQAQYKTKNQKGQKRYQRANEQIDFAQRFEREGKNLRQNIKKKNIYQNWDNTQQQFIQMNKTNYNSNQPIRKKEYRREFSQRKQELSSPYSQSNSRNITKNNQQEKSKVLKEDYSFIENLSKPPSVDSTTEVPRRGRRIKK